MISLGSYISIPHRGFVIVLKTNILIKVKNRIVLTFPENVLVSFSLEVPFSRESLA